MSARANLAQIEEDLEAAGLRIEETYYEWAGQLAREAASDVLRLLEAEFDRESPPAGEIGTLEHRVDALAGRAEGLGELVEPARVLDEVLDPTLEPDHDPGLERREGGAREYLVEEDAREALQAARRIVRTCRERLED